MRMWKILLSVCCFCFLSISAYAGVQWLPDYLGANPTGRVTDGTGRKIVNNTKNCDSYGLIETIPANMKCTKYFPGDGLTCYKDCVCDNSFSTITFDASDEKGYRCGATCTEEDGTTKYKNCCKFGNLIYASCKTGYKFNGGDLGCGTCVPENANDVCPSGKKAEECEHGTLEKVDETEANTPCYICKDCTDNTDCDNGVCIDGICVDNICDADLTMSESECGSFGGIKVDEYPVKTSTTELIVKCYKCNECAIDGDCDEEEVCKKDASGVNVCLNDECDEGSKECQYGTIQVFNTTDAGSQCYECSDCALDSHCDNGYCEYGKCYDCENGYSASVTSCGTGFTLETDASGKCGKCVNTITCPDNFSMDTPNCDDGKSICYHSSNQACKGCCGTACDSGYSTSIDTCDIGQELVEQTSNLNCKKCTGTPCDTDNDYYYSETPPTCKPNYKPVSQTTNGKCYKCADDTCKTGAKQCEHGAVKQISTTAAGTICYECKECTSDSHCDNGYCNNNKCVTCQEGFSVEKQPVCYNGQEACRQTDNYKCMGCCSIYCDAGYSTSITSCGQGQSLATQNGQEQCKKCITCKTYEKVSNGACVCDNVTFDHWENEGNFARLTFTAMFMENEAGCKCDENSYTCECGEFVANCSEYDASLTTNFARFYSCQQWHVEGLRVKCYYSRGNTTITKPSSDDFVFEIENGTQLQDDNTSNTQLDTNLVRACEVNIKSATGTSGATCYYVEDTD